MQDERSVTLQKVNKPFAQLSQSSICAYRKRAPQLRGSFASLGYPKGPKDPIIKLGTWVSDSSYVGYYFGEYMIIRYLDP